MSGAFWFFLGIATAFVGRRVIPAMFFILVVKRSASQHGGVVYQDHPQGGMVFMSRNPISKKVIEFHVTTTCGNLGKKWFGGWWVPARLAWTVREAISHDAQNPQVMVSTVTKGPLAGVTLLEA
jgi:hypothetical protein